ncbi:hypothetical protein HY214_01520 [Candidatus Roizmanbacteria bacterium]|nr:hypothetical protein [Candidatus Roizmanbacteria bacterium]
MDKQPVHYTPLPPSLQVVISIPSSRRSPGFLLMNIVAFLAAVTGVVLFRVQRQTALEKPLTQSKAAVAKPACIKNDVLNPISVKAWTKKNGTDIEVVNKSTIIAAEIFFSWQPVQNAKSYFVYLATRKARFDPAAVGTETKDTTFEADRLKKDSSYFFYVRSKSENNTLAFEFPTPGDCKFTVASHPIFEFKTAP